MYFITFIPLIVQNKYNRFHSNLKRSPLTHDLFALYYSISSQRSAVKRSLAGPGGILMIFLRRFYVKIINKKPLFRYHIKIRGCKIYSIKTLVSVMLRLIRPVYRYANVLRLIFA